jgi:creatinine amidohydrolase
MKSPQPVILADAPHRDVTHARYDLAVLMWGATEPHNYHLPYGADIIETEHIGREAVHLAAARGARVVLLPIIPFGVNTGQLDIPLTINMNPSTQMAVLRDVVVSLEHHGVPRLVILNGHGGNDFRQMIRELSIEHKIFLSTVNWFRCVPLKEYFDAPGDHADEMETSLLLHLAPHLVLPLSEAGDGKENKMKISGFREGWAWAPRDWRRVTADTGTGNPKAATAEKGARYFAAVTHNIADFLVELASTKPSELYEKS